MDSVAFRCRKTVRASTRAWSALAHASFGMVAMLIASCASSGPCASESVPADIGALEFECDHAAPRCVVRTAPLSMWSSGASIVLTCVTEGHGASDESAPFSLRPNVVLLIVTHGSPRQNLSTGSWIVAGAQMPVLGSGVDRAAFGVERQFVVLDASVIDMGGARKEGVHIEHHGEVGPVERLCVPREWIDGLLTGLEAHSASLGRR